MLHGLIGGQGRGRGAREKRIPQDFTNINGRYGSPPGILFFVVVRELLETLLCVAVCRWL